MSMVRAMLQEKKLPQELWGEPVSTTIYIINHSLTKSLQGQTPHENCKRRPSIDHMRTFGSIVHVKETKGHLS